MKILLDTCVWGGSRQQLEMAGHSEFNLLEAIASFMLAVKDSDLDKIPGAKDTNFLPKEIAARYNVLITVPPQPLQAVSPG